jgi:hypothetical protein
MFTSQNNLNNTMVLKGGIQFIFIGQTHNIISILQKITVSTSLIYIPCRTDNVVSILVGHNVPSKTLLKYYFGMEIKICGSSAGV